MPQSNTMKVEWKRKTTTPRIVDIKRNMLTQKSQGESVGEPKLPGPDIIIKAAAAISPGTMGRSKVVTQ